MNICKTVTLRTRKIKEGRQLSFYLDYYPGYRDDATMKVIRHESLGIYIYAKPKNQRERDYNERMTERAEALRCRRYEAVVNERYDFFDKEKTKGDFLAYFKAKAEKKNTKWEHVYKHFHRFTGGKCTFGEIDVGKDQGDAAAGHVVEVTEQLDRTAQLAAFGQQVSGLVDNIDKKQKYL